MRHIECAFKKQVWRLSNHYARHFSKWIDCVRQQYSNYTIGNPNGDPSKFFQVDGNITLGENIADHGGLKIAEIAYEKWLATKSNGEPDIVLPALENFRFIYLQFDKKNVLWHYPQLETIFGFLYFLYHLQRRTAILFGICITMVCRPHRSSNAQPRYQRRACTR